MIEFFSEQVPLPALDYEKIEKWIQAVAASHGFEVGSITYCFCDDPYILSVNRQFLNHDYFTDIITFDYTRHYKAGPEERKEAGSADSKEKIGETSRESIMLGKIGGDMVISIDTVRSNALSLGVSYDQELLRVIIHGVLHLCGIDDKGPGEREIMEANENAALALLFSCQ
ncbi:MAG: rRNA maturation RNase YbeY [Muribaculaceae bacterium]|nr:rRNA maturation RNase YbeY [Muribaculaceae bacterium]